MYVTIVITRIKLEQYSNEKWNRNVFLLNWLTLIYVSNIMPLDTNNEKSINESPIKKVEG